MRNQRKEKNQVNYENSHIFKKMLVREYESRDMQFSSITGNTPILHE